MQNVTLLICAGIIGAICGVVSLIETEIVRFLKKKNDKK